VTGLRIRTGRGSIIISQSTAGLSILWNDLSGHHAARNQWLPDSRAKISTVTHLGQANAGRHYLAFLRDITDSGCCDSIHRARFAMVCDERDARSTPIHITADRQRFRPIKTSSEAQSHRNLILGKNSSPRDQVAVITIRLMGNTSAATCAPVKWQLPPLIYHAQGSNRLSPLGQVREPRELVPTWLPTGTAARHASPLPAPRIPAEDVGGMGSA
jgi:hypothetical protein